MAANRWRTGNAGAIVTIRAWPDSTASSKGIALARASEQFRQSDVTTWGVVALVCASIAVMGSNVSALLPHDVLANLHKTRIEGASLEHLRSQMADLREETQRLKRDNGLLAARFALDEQEGNEVIRRVGALEETLPRLLESPASAPAIDRASVTATIDQPAPQLHAAIGGSVSVQQQPLIAPAPEQPLPARLETARAIPPSRVSYGIALGPPITAEQAPATWRDLSMQLGPLLFGLGPLLADETGSDGKRIVAGPLTQLSEASALCARLERLSVPCLPIPFTGAALDY
jgi:hypothetical protein